MTRQLRRLMLRARARLSSALERARERTAHPVVELDQVHRRLEFLIAALYGQGIAIEAADARTEPGWFTRYLFKSRGRQLPSNALPVSDGMRIRLPRALDATEKRGGEARALARYRVLALEQAERVLRGTAAHYPTDDYRLVQDLYALREGSIIESRIAHTVGGTREAIDDVRATSLASRPLFALLTPAERTVERLIRESLTRPLGEMAESTATESLAWAQETARGMGREPWYRGLRPVRHWGVVDASAQGRLAARDAFADRYSAEDRRMMAMPSQGLRTKRGSGGNAESDRASSASERADDSTVQRAVTSEQWTRDRNSTSGVTTAGGAGHAGTNADAPRAEEVAPEEREPTTDPWSGTPESLAAHVAPPPLPGVQYAEWDHVVDRYRERAVTVRMMPPAEGDSAWASSVMREHAPLVRAIRQRFERLRAQRLRHARQRDGDALDLAACVRALVDLRMGQTPDDRLYMAVRDARHPLAIMLLADVSGSANAQVTGTLRMIDIEKMALLLASEALTALGDRYSIMTFNGHGPDDVRATMVKGFGESQGEQLRERIAALHPSGFTRLGAAVRHATAALRNEPARHRLLLILSDGRPNDIGHYVAEYGVEDSRQAIHEARARGIYPFCLNVDREDPEYVARIFGPSGYTTLRRPDQLPLALLQAVRSLIST